MKEENKQTLPTPLINGYKLIKESNKEAQQIPIFTWGEVASTPNLLNVDKKKFEVQQTPLRETLAHSLANRTKKQKEETKMT